MQVRPVAFLKVVRSSARDGMLSLRGPRGAGQHDPIHPHITSAGFEDGDEVVLIRRDLYEVLIARSAVYEEDHP